MSKLKFAISKGSGPNICFSPEVLPIDTEEGETIEHDLFLGPETDTFRTFLVPKNVLS